MRVKHQVRTHFSDLPVLLSITLVGLMLRLYKLGSQSIWGDEFLTLSKYSAGHDLADVFGRIWHAAAHPPLYFLIVHYWYLIGKSEFMLRFPSAVFGILCIPAAYALANTLFGKSTARITAALVAFSPIAIWYSQEARMYSLQLLLGLLATLYFVKIWREPKAKTVAAYVLLMIAGLFTHMATVSLAAAHGIFAFTESMRKPKRLAAWVGIQLLVILGFSPWLMNIVNVRQHASGELRIGYDRPSSLIDVGYGLYTFCVGYSIGPSVAELHEKTGMSSVKPYAPLVGLSCLVFGTLVVLGLIRARRIDKWAFWFLLVMLAVPAILAAAATLLPHIPLNPRYMLVAVIPYWMVLALGIEFAIQRKAWRVLPVAASVLLLFSIYNDYFQPRYAKQDMRSAVTYLDAHTRSGDAIIISSIELGGPFIYYHKSSEIPYFGYPEKPGLVDPGKLHGDMRKLSAGKKRVWLLLGRTWSSDPKNLIPGYFSSNGQRLESRRYNGVSLFCYDTPPTSHIK